MTLDEIAESNPHLDMGQIKEWQELRDGVPGNGAMVRIRRTQSGRDVRVHIDDSAKSDSRTVKLMKY
jgi:hypothetical protein